MKKTHWYSNSWSEFEVQSLAYSILRKQLYPEFLVRGEFSFDYKILKQDFPGTAKGCRIDICIFKPWFGDTPPEPVLLIEVKKGDKSISEAQGKRYSTLIGVPCLYIRGQKDAYNVLDLVRPYLYK